MGKVLLLVDTENEEGLHYEYIEIELDPLYLKIADGKLSLTAQAIAAFTSGGGGGIDETRLRGEVQMLQASIADLNQQFTAAIQNTAATLNEDWTRQLQATMLDLNTSWEARFRDLESRIS